MIVSGEVLKENAKQKLQGKWTEPVLTTLVYNLITGGVSYVINFAFALVFGVMFAIILVPIFSELMSLETASTLVEAVTSGVGNLISAIVFIFLAPLTVGFLGYFLGLAKNQEVKLSDIFGGYKKCFGNSVLANFLMGLYIFLWSLLFIVPGIIKSYAYSMTNFIIADNPNISATEAIKMSEEMMKGHKCDYFVLQLSFIGWAILALFTCCVGYLWLTPYMNTTYASFYINLKSDYEARKQGIQMPY